MASYLINCLPDMANKSYLELGIYKGATFNNVASKHKVSVDNEQAAMYKMTTDAFFAQLEKQALFDVIYIDACHEVQHVVRDFNNSVKHLRPGGLIFVHDLIPPNREFTAQHYCGDGYKFLSYYMKAFSPDHYMSLTPAEGDYGLTVFIRPQHLVPATMVTYEEFMEELKSVRLYTKEEIKAFLRRYEWNES